MPSIGLEHLMHAEEAARGLDLPEARLPQPGHHEGEHDEAEVARVPLRGEQHQRRDRHQHDLPGELAVERQAHVEQ